MLYIFDKDGTLIGGASNRPANTPDEQVLLPNVKRIIKRFRDRGDSIAIASNQGGVAWGFISYEQADELLRDCAEKIGGVDAYEFCPHDDRKNEPCECRKPKPGMILKIAERLGYEIDEIVFVGDQDTDEQAARAAGVAYVPANIFFEPKGWGGVRAGAKRPPLYADGAMIKAPQFMATKKQIDFCKAQAVGYSAFIRGLIDHEMKYAMRRKQK